MDQSISPVLSIIIPTYNSAATLHICLNSLLNQSYKDFEVLIIDGASKDDTVSIANTFSDKIKNLIVYSEKDQGTYDAMNKGIQKANGEWLYFLGSDDRLWDNHVLENIFAENSNIVQDADLLYGNIFSNRLGGKYDGAFSVQKILERSICHQAIFYRKALFQHLGMYHLKYKMSADWDFNLKCFLDPAVRTRYVDLIIAEFADGGLSSNHDAVHWNDRIGNIVKYDKGALSRTEKANFRGDLALEEIKKRKSGGYIHLLYAFLFSDKRWYFFKYAVNIKLKRL